MHIHMAFATHWTTLWGVWMGLNTPSERRLRSLARSVIWFGSTTSAYHSKYYTVMFRVSRGDQAGQRQTWAVWSRTTYKDHAWGVDIMISTEAMCLAVLLDSSLTLAPHVRRLSVDPSAAADRRIRRRKFVRRKSAGKITARRISRRILLAVNPP